MRVLLSNEDIKSHLRLVSKEFIKYNNVQEPEYVLASTDINRFFSSEEGVLYINLEFVAVPIKHLKKYKFLKLYFMYDYESELYPTEVDKSKESYIIDLDYRNNKAKPLIFDVDTYRKVIKTNNHRLQKVIFDNEIKYIEKRHLNKHLHSFVVLVDLKTLKIKLPLKFYMHLCFDKKDIF